MARNLENVVEFGPEDAGRRVGWVSTGRLKDYPVEIEAPLVLNLVTATVGPEGGSFGYWTPNSEDGEEVLSLPTYQGLFAIYAMSAHLRSNAAIRSTPFFAGASESKPRSHSAWLLDRGISRGYYTEEDEPVVWAKGPELWGILKERLADEGLEESYEHVYYEFNGMIGRFRGVHGDSFEGLSLDELLLPDETMHDRTVYQLDFAKKLVGILQREINENERMYKELLDSSASKNVGFDTLARNERRREGLILDSVSQLIAGRLVYLPVGCLSEYHPWSHLHPGENGEVNEGSSQENIGRRASVIAALKNETTELEYRKKYAEDGANQLEQLAKLESR